MQGGLVIGALNSPFRGPGSKPMGGSKVDSGCHFFKVNQMSIRNTRELVVKSKLSPCSGSAVLRQLNAIHRKGI